MSFVDSKKNVKNHKPYLLRTLVIITYENDCQNYKNKPQLQ